VSDLIGSQRKDKDHRYTERFAGRRLAKKSSRVGTGDDPRLDDPITDYQEILVWRVRSGNAAK
jgi:hypothetical protein